MDSINLNLISVFISFKLPLAQLLCDEVIIEYGVLVVLFRDGWKRLWSDSSNLGTALLP